MRSSQWFYLSLTAIFLLFFPGCGGNSGSGPVPPQPPSALTYTAGTAVYTTGVAITPNNPTTSGGPVTAYGVTPSLPVGLSLSTTTGVINGTPTTATATASYTVTASNSAGKTTATLTITVNAAASMSLGYSTPAAVYAAGVAIAPNSPITTGGTATAYSVNPALPSGLSIDPSAGIVSGTPTAALPTAAPTTSSYTVTASNSTASATATLTITLYNAPQSVPNLSQSITPLAPPNSTFEFLDTGAVVSDPFNPQVAPVEWMAGQAVSSVVSPDGKTLLVLTSGFNRIFQALSLSPAWRLSNEYVFIYDISNHTPVFKQLVPIPNSYNGIVFDPSGTAFYVASGMGDFPYDSNGNLPPQGPVGLDNIHIITLNPSTGIWAEQIGTQLVVGHSAGNGLPVPKGTTPAVNAMVYVYPCAAGVAISNDGQTLVVANYYNDSITVFTGGLGNWKPLPSLPDPKQGTLLPGELDLRPGKNNLKPPLPGTPGGEYPFWVVVTGSGSNWNAYVSSVRDREIDVVSPCYGNPQVCTNTPAVTARIPVKGQPNKMTLNQAQTRLYVAEDESDTVDVIDTTKNAVVESIPVVAPAQLLSNSSLAQYTGANTDSVTLSPDETTLYVTNGNLNDVAVVTLQGNNPPSGDVVSGLIPTGWYPNAISFSADGEWAYVVNSKSPTGANPNWCYIYGPPAYPTCAPANEYSPQLTKAGLQSFPVAGAMAQLTSLTNQVATNNRFSSTSTTGPVMGALQSAIQHVIYILKENRTYDQVLGDLGTGNGDPSLAMFGAPITPNLHNLAQNFVTLDNFMDSAETSNDGWPWSTSARAPDVIERQFPVTYGFRGLSLDSEGVNRSVNVAMPTVAQRQAGDPLTPDDPDLLPGQTDVAAPDGPNDEVNTGYLWDAALRAGLTVRNYGFFVDTTCYNAPACQIPLTEYPFSTNTIVAYPASVSLAPNTDPFFRGFDNAFPDFYRYKEWERDFDTNYAQGGLPSLSLVRFMHDHTGSFATSIDLVNTPDRDVADNDYAVGLLVQKIANSPIYKNNTLIFIVEDDAQDGGDHVDSHRTTAFVAGPYVKTNQVVSTAYNTIDFVRTMEEVLGLPPMNLNDALATPMADVFDLTQTAWSFTATPAPILYCTNLPLPLPAQPCTNPTPNARYWARVTKGLDFTDADRVDGASFNRILWKGLMGAKPYPAAPTGIDLRQNRGKLLANYWRSLSQAGPQSPKTRKN